MKLRHSSRGFHSLELVFAFVVVGLVVVGAAVIQKRHTNSTFAEVDTIPTISGSEYNAISSTETKPAFIVSISKNDSTISIAKISHADAYLPSANIQQPTHRVQTLDENRTVLSSKDINLLGTLSPLPPAFGSPAQKINPVATFNTDTYLPYNSSAHFIRIVTLKNAVVTEKTLDDIHEMTTSTKFRALSSSGSTLSRTTGGNQAHHKETIAIIGNGYPSGSTQFVSDVNAISTELFKYEPFKTRRNQIDIVYADNNTADLGCSRWAAPYDRIVTCDMTKVRQVLTSRGIPFDTVMVVWNTSQVGGASYLYDHMSFITNAGNIGRGAVHELGHSVAQLNDEYSYGGNGTQDNQVWANCYRGNPPARAWDIPLASYTNGCSFDNYYKSSSTSIMESLSPAYFNFVSLMVINAELDRVAGSFVNDAAPTVRITSPAAGDVSSDSLTQITIAADDDDAIVRATLLMNGVPILDSYEPPSLFGFRTPG